MAEGEMFGWYHQLDGHEFEQAPGDGKGQESLACCSPWGHTESDRTAQLNNNSNNGLSVCLIIHMNALWVVEGFLCCF